MFLEAVSRDIFQMMFAKVVLGFFGVNSMVIFAHIIDISKDEKQRTILFQWSSFLWSISFTFGPLVLYLTTSLKIAEKHVMMGASVLQTLSGLIAYTCWSSTEKKEVRKENILKIDPKKKEKKQLSPFFESLKKSLSYSSKMRRLFFSHYSKY